jgi:ketosteroid isomerase-like protein
VSQENVELVRQLWDAFQRGDLEWMVERCTADAAIVQPPETPDATTYFGRTALVDAAEGFPRDWEGFRLDLTEIIDVSEEIVLSVCRNRGRGRISGLEMDMDMFYVHRIRAGKMAHVQIFLSREQALRAARLEE